jgi:excisionase family DNA binding protein
MPVAEPMSLSPEGAAEYTSLSKPTIYRLLAAGTIKGKRAGTRTMIDGESLRAYYRALPDYAAGHAIPNAPQSLAQNRRRRTARKVRS